MIGAQACVEAMSDLNYDFFLTSRSAERDAEALKPPRLRAVEWHNTKSSRGHSGRSQHSPQSQQGHSHARCSRTGGSASPGLSPHAPDSSGSFSQELSRAALALDMSGSSSPCTRVSNGNGARSTDTEPSQARGAPSSGVYSYSGGSGQLVCPGAVVGHNATTTLTHCQEASLADYYELIMGGDPFNDGLASPTQCDRPAVTSPPDLVGSSGALPRMTSGELEPAAKVAPWLAHHSTMSLLSDGDDDDDARLRGTLISMPSRESIRTNLEGYLSFLMNGSAEFTVNLPDGTDPAAADASVAVDKTSETARIRPNTFSPSATLVGMEGDGSRPGAALAPSSTAGTTPTTTATTPSAAPFTPQYQPPVLPSRRRRREQLVSFKSQMVEVASIDLTPRTIAYPKALFRNPTVREMGREMQRPAEVRRRLLRERQLTVHTVAIVDEDAVGSPLLVACGTHVRVYPTLSSREESVPSFTNKRRVGSSSSRRTSTTSRRAEVTTATTSPDQILSFDEFDHQFVVDEAVSRPSGSSQYASVALDELQKTWLNGRNACLVLGASKARNVGTAVVAKQFLDSAAVDLSLSLREDAGDGSWFEMHLSMGEVFDTLSETGERGCEVRDLLTPASLSSPTAPTADVHISTSAFFGPTLWGLTERTFADGASAALQNAITQGYIQYTKDVEGWSAKYGGMQNLTEPVCFAQVHLKTVRHGDRVRTESRKTDAHHNGKNSGEIEVFLSSLLIVFAGTAPVTVHALSDMALQPFNSPNARRNWKTSEGFLTTLMRSAFGGATRTAVCACLSDCDTEVSVSWLECLAHVRNVQNEVPLTGNVGAFVRCLQAALDTAKGEATLSGGADPSAPALETGGIREKINQLQQFLKDPTISTPKLSWYALALIMS